MGTIRSRNLSIVPILQSIAQIKAVFPQEKWEVFLDNCAVMIYLGSGPAAFSTHEYISKLLGEMTIDTRTDGVTSGAHGNSSLNNQRAGRGLMTPGEVKRLDRKKCLIFMEGQYPIMDWKNLPFNTAVWKESERLAGKEGYKHPVRVVYNPKTMTYRTILNKSKFQVKEEWNLSGTIEQCIIRYASKLDGDQMNEILLGLEEGLTDEQVKSYFKLPADQMKQYRREILNEK